jgi:predicted ATPase
MLKTLRLKPFDKRGFPFDLPVLQNFKEIEIDLPITIFIGDNGCGKSTILETLAYSIGLPTISSKSIETDGSLKAAKLLAPYFQLSWTNKTRQGLFFRAEDFTGFIRSVNELRSAFDKDMQDFEASLEGHSLERVRGMITGQKNALIEKYGSDLNAYSHGEGFLKIFESRFTQKGIYILDEPEASLSPLRQLSLISLIKEMVQQRGAQFILATHSPILMGIPNAKLLELRDGLITQTSFEETEHYRITKGFLENREQFLRFL